MEPWLLKVIFLTFDYDEIAHKQFWRSDVIKRSALKKEESLKYNIYHLESSLSKAKSIFCHEIQKVRRSFPMFNVYSCNLGSAALDLADPLTGCPKVRWCEKFWKGWSISPAPDQTSQSWTIHTIESLRTMPNCKVWTRDWGILKSKEEI